MKEVVMQYSNTKSLNWLQRKFYGCVNRYFQLKRHLSFHLHVLLHPIRLDLSKLLPGSMPVLINNFNRLSPLKVQLQWLLSLPEKISIVIVDNHSDYAPLLDYYRKLDLPNAQVVQLGINSCLHGVSYISRQLKGFDKFIITDPDLHPYPDTPVDLVSHLSGLMDKYPGYNHIGPSLEINDLPPDSPLTEPVRRNELRFWPPNTPRLNNEVIVAQIDSTFAMYRRSSHVRKLGPALRTDRPYTLCHIDWYIIPVQCSEEYRMYLKTCNTFATWATEIKRQKWVTVSLVPTLELAGMLQLF